MKHGKKNPKPYKNGHVKCRKSRKSQTLLSVICNPQCALLGDMTTHKFLSLGVDPHGSVMGSEPEVLLGCSFISVVSWGHYTEP